MTIFYSHLTIGDKVVDEPTGFTGEVTGLAMYAGGEETVLVQPPVDEEKRFREPLWFSVKRVSLVEQ